MNTNNTYFDNLYRIGCEREAARAERQARKQQIIDTLGWDSEELKAWYEEDKAAKFLFSQGILERAEYASQELQIRFLLELLDEMKLDPDEREEQELHGACYDYNDFFRWTKHPVSDGLILNGQITRFDNDLVIRYLENVTVLDDGFEVRFKAGITVKV